MSNTFSNYDLSASRKKALGINHRGLRNMSIGDAFRLEIAIMYAQIAILIILGAVIVKQIFG